MARKWTMLREITSFDWLPTNLKNTVESYNERIRELIERRSEINEEAERIRAGEMDLAAFELTNDHRYQVVATLEAEKALRTEIAEQLGPAFQKAMHEARRKADEEHREVFCEIYCELLKLGYLRNHEMERGTASAAVSAADEITKDFAADGSQVGRIQPVHVMAHPRVSAALGRYRERNEYAGGFPWFTENLQALEQLARDFAEIKKKLIASI